MIFVWIGCLGVHLLSLLKGVYGKLGLNNIGEYHDYYNRHM